MENDLIKELKEHVIYDIKRIDTFPGDINLDEDIEMTKMKILYLIYQELKGLNEKLDEIVKQWKK